MNTFDLLCWWSAIKSWIRIFQIYKFDNIPMICRFDWFDVSTQSNHPLALLCTWMIGGSVLRYLNYFHTCFSNSLQHKIFESPRFLIFQYEGKIHAFYIPSTNHFTCFPLFSILRVCLCHDTGLVNISWIKKNATFIPFVYLSKAFIQFWDFSSSMVYLPQDIKIFFGKRNFLLAVGTIMNNYNSTIYASQSRSVGVSPLSGVSRLCHTDGLLFPVTNCSHQVLFMADLTLMAPTNHLLYKGFVGRGGWL